MKIISTTFSFTLIYQLPTLSKTDQNYYIYFFMYNRKLTLYVYQLSLPEQINN